MLQNLPKRVHFVGIGGVGMSGLADILLTLGHEVSGSDICDGEIIQRLTKKGASCFIGHRSENVLGAELLVASSAISNTNPELLKANKDNIKVVHRSYILKALMEAQLGIAVAGAHGKTTTSSMLSMVLENNNYKPTIVVGGELNFIKGNAKYGEGKYLVAEADESDGSFLNLDPFSVLITNIEDDHLDHYGSVEKIKEAFQKFINKIPTNGMGVLCLDDAGVREVAKNCNSSKLYYSLQDEKADYYLKNISFGAKFSKGEVYEKGQFLGELKLQVPGEHNLANALGVVAMSRWLGLGFKEIALILKDFTGAGRRFELLGEVNGIRVVDDYGHHPTEIAATLRAASKVCGGRLICVFQPHRYTRTKLLSERFGESFGDASVIIINEIYSAGESPIEGISAKLIVEAIERHENREIIYIPRMEDIVDYLMDFVAPLDLVIFMGAGNIRKAGISLVNRLKEVTSNES